MNNQESLLIDVIKILPDGVDCYIQAPGLEDEEILSIWQDTEYDYYKCIKLNEVNKDFFLNKIKDHSIVDDFQSIEIKLDRKLLFEGWDGVEIGTISNTIFIPNWFKEKHIQNEDCGISDDW